MKSIPNLIAIFYHNIGPFQRDCSLFFDKGKYLIKAKVGSGKSFLFFDGPTFALYGDKGMRKMLNMKSKEGKVCLLFEVDGQLFLIHRGIIRKGLKSYQYTTQLFEVRYSGKDIIHDIRNIIGTSDILLRDTNLLEIIRSHPELFSFSLMDFKLSKDIDAALKEFIISKEVFLNTIFLLQDSQNIFEVTPSERLTIFKNVFGLLGIDDGKEVLAEKKRSLEADKKHFSNMSDFDRKLAFQLKKLKSEYEGLQKKGLGVSTDTQDFFTLKGDFIEQGKISILDFALPKELSSEITQYRTSLIAQHLEYIKLRERFSSEQEHYSTQEQGVQKMQQEQTQLLHDLKEISGHLEGINDKEIEQLEQQKQEISFRMKEKQKSLQDLQKSIDYTVFQHVGEQSTFEFSYSAPLEDFAGLQQFWTLFVEHGKILRNEQTRLTSDLVDTDTQIQQLQEVERQRIDKEFQDLLGNYEQKSLEYHNFLETLEGEKTFHCSEINGNCPFVEHLNQAHFQNMQKQQQILGDTVASLKRQVDTFDIEGKKRCILQQPLILSVLRVQQEKQQRKNTVDMLLQKMGTFLKEQNYTHFQELKVIYDQGQKEVETLLQQFQTVDSTLLQLQKKKAELQIFQEKKLTLEVRLHTLQNTLQAEQERLNQLRLLLDEIQHQLQQPLYQQIEDTLRLSEEMLQTLRDIELLVEDSFHYLQKAKRVEVELEQVTNLYTLFSKELTIYVLERYLPTLSDIINNYLGQIVDYQIKMFVEITSKNDLELKTFIFDTKGEREVNSLSGGQRTILKLVRMLAISSHFKTPLLFLDETINNLDGETVEAVSNVINNFVKQRTTKFYTVTHNSDIQAMNIWDQIISF